MFLNIFSTNLKSNTNKLDIWEECLPIRNYVISSPSVKSVWTDVSLQSKVTHTF